MTSAATETSFAAREPLFSAWQATGPARHHLVVRCFGIPVAAFSLILQQRSVSGSPTGSPVAIETMLDFASRHNVAPQTEHFPMSKINEAFARLESGKARYRIVLDADF